MKKIVQFALLHLIFTYIEFIVCELNTVNDDQLVFAHVVSEI